MNEKEKENEEMNLSSAEENVVDTNENLFNDNTV